MNSFEEGTSIKIFRLIALSLGLYFVTGIANVLAQIDSADNDQNPSTEESKEERVLDEIIVSAPGPQKTLTVRAGWRPQSPEEAHEHIGNAYALVTELDQLAKKCDIDSVTTYGSKLRLRPCEKFLQRHDSRALTNYNIQCQGVVEWYREQVETFQQDPDWASNDPESLTAFNFFKQNIILACDLKTVVKNFRDLDSARHNIAKIRAYVANDLNPQSGVGGFAPINDPRAEEPEEQ